MIKANFYRCDVCALALKVLVDVRDVAGSLAKTKCPRHECLGNMFLISEVLFRTMVEANAPNYILDSTQFLSAVNGFGLPDELEASEEFVQALFQTKKVRSVATQRGSNPKRTVLSSVTFENGLTLHMASGGDGPTIYKITRGFNDGVDHKLPENTGNDLVQCEDQGVSGGQGAGGVPQSPPSNGDSGAPPCRDSAPELRSRVSPEASK